MRNALLSAAKNTVDVDYSAKRSIVNRFVTVNTKAAWTIAQAPFQQRHLRLLKRPRHCLLKTNVNWFGDTKKLLAVRMYSPISTLASPAAQTVLVRISVTSNTSETLRSVLATLTALTVAHAQEKMYSVTPTAPQQQLKLPHRPLLSQSLLPQEVK